MKVSVIIPAHNAGRKLERLLVSLSSVDRATTEVIVIDDASDDNTVWFARQFPWVRILRQPRNTGVAAARNRGGGAARNEILLFLDADVECFPDTIEQVRATYKKQPELSACSGIIALPPKSTPFFPRYKGIRTYGYWMIENRGGFSNQPFGNACGSVRTHVFRAVCGFDEIFAGASLEDADFGSRLVRAGYKVGFNPKIRIKHRFDDFVPMVKKYIHRSRVWTRLFLTNRSFENVGMTHRESINGVIAATVIPLVLIAGAGVLVQNWFLVKITGILILIALATHLVLARRFYHFTAQETDILFMFATIKLQLFLYSVIYAAAASAALEVLLERLDVKPVPTRW